MRIQSFYLFLLLVTALPVAAFPSSLKGRVTEAAGQKPLAGATLSIPELRLSAETDHTGAYIFPSLPSKGRFLIEVRYVGYKTTTQMVDLSNTTDVNFSLEKSVIEVQEVVITGTASTSANTKNSTSVAVLNKADLMKLPSTNIIDAISRVPGISQITTGGAVSKPVIRGLSYNRVITLSDGVKQEGQQWGDEHGIEIDQYKAGRVEILRGAASLLYGSDAMGGVINIIDPIPPSPGQLKGELISNYATNNGLSGTSAMLEGNQNGFVWRARGTYKNAFGYNTPQYRLPNTGFHETDFSTQLGFNKNWGYTHLDLSSFRQKLGLPEFELNQQGQFVRTDEETGEETILDPDQYKTRHLLLPFQDVRHYKAALNSYILLGESRLRSTLAFQNSQRRELEDDASSPSLFFDLKTVSYDVKYYFRQSNGWEPSLGISGAFQYNKNKGPELLVPDYHSQDLGAFAYAKKSWTNTTFNIGLRFDYRNIHGEQMMEEGEIKFSDFSNNFSNISGAAGITHEFTPHLNFKANIGSAFRAPNVAELSTNGLHEGTLRYEVGDPSLSPERSLYSDASIEYHTDKLNVFFNAYNNYIHNYIYLRRLSDEEMEEGHPVYHYVQDNADLYGFETGLTLHPAPWFHFENSFSLTRGKNSRISQGLPFIPAPLLRNELRFEPDVRGLQNTWFSVGLDNFMSQNHVDMFETPTPAYTLVNASLGTTLKIGPQELQLNISGNNLLNKAYIDHLSRFKTEGFLNPGRNISFGIRLPFEAK